MIISVKRKGAHMDISSETETILREFAQVPFSEAPPIAEYAPYPAECLRIDEGQAVASIGDLVTDEEYFEETDFDETIEVVGYNSTRVVVGAGLEGVIVDGKVYDIEELLNLMEVLPRALRAAMENSR
jgi:hypothetical protein